jgi:hypothetical protein
VGVLEAQIDMFYLNHHFLMCLDTECHRCSPTRAVGRVGAPGVGGGAGMVGWWRCHRGCGGGRLADAPLYSPSGRYVLVTFRFLKRKVNMSKRVKYLQNFVLFTTR